MSVSKRTHSREFKIEMCEQIKRGQMTKTSVARVHNLAPSMVDRWLAKYEELGVPEKRRL